MPSTQQFRKRIKSVKSTSQITKAMEMVASVKMQKAIKAMSSARQYTQNAWNLLTTLAGKTTVDKHPLLQRREVSRTLLIIAGSDRGLCGSYNSDQARKVLAYFNSASNNVEVIAIGKKSADIVRKLGGNLIAEFPSFELDVEFWESRPVSKIMIDGYINKTYDKVDIIYSHFISSIKQTPVIKQLLPIDNNHIDLPELWEQKSEQEELTEYKFEPTVDLVLERIIPQLLRVQVYGAMLESNAAEHSSRMVAMKNATDNAKDLIDELTLVYNSVRQGSITREIAEISGAAESMK